MEPSENGFMEPKCYLLGQWLTLKIIFSRENKPFNLLFQGPKWLSETKSVLCIGDFQHTPCASAENT